MEIKRLVLILLMIVLTNSAVSAETTTWSASGGGFWNAAANWNTNTIPGLEDDAVINNSGAGAITVDYDAIIKTLSLGGAKNIRMSAGKLTISSSVPNIIYVSKSGLDSNLGTIGAPKLTIAGALAAISGSINKIHVSAGVYNEDVTLDNGISLYGGFSANNWNDRNITDRGNAAYRTVIQGISTGSSGCSVSFIGTANAPWILEGFVIETNHAGNSYGVCVYIEGGAATIRYNTINGGPGSNESIGIYLHGPTSSTVVSSNDINGGASTANSSSGIYIETAANQIITDDTINGGTGNGESRGIIVTHPLASSSLISRNSIYGGSGTGGTSYGIRLLNYTDASSLNVSVYGNYIHAENADYAIGISCYGSAADTSVQPGIFNNVIEAVATGSSGSRAWGLYFSNVSGTPLVYNNTISVNSLSDQAYGIQTEALSDGRATQADVRNNIFLCESTIPHDFGLLEGDIGNSSYIQNNDIYNCTTIINSGHTPYGTIAGLNGLRPDSTSGNIDNEPVLSASPVRNLTALSPPSVTWGGLDLSAVSTFPQSGGNKIDKAGTVRTAPWSIGAYEKN